MLNVFLQYGIISFQVCPSQEYERKLHPDDLPLLVQRSWPQDTDCHFRVRRNPRAPPLPPRTNLPSLPTLPLNPLPPLPSPTESQEDDEPSRALSALSLEADDKRYSPVYKFPSISYCRETKNDYLYIWLAINLIRVKGLMSRKRTVRKKLLWCVNKERFRVKCK